MGEWDRNMRTYTERELAQEAKERYAAVEIGIGYMRGTHSLQDIVSYLNGFHWPMTYTEVQEWIQRGVNESITDNTAIESRKQPVQDKQDVKGIYARKIKHPNYDKKPWGKPVLRLSQDDLDDSFRWQLHITVEKRSN